MYVLWLPVASLPPLPGEAALKLEDIERLCNYVANPPDPGEAFASYDAWRNYSVATMRDVLPLLLNVAKAAKAHRESDDDCSPCVTPTGTALSEALAALEAEG